MNKLITGFIAGYLIASACVHLGRGATIAIVAFTGFALMAASGFVGVKNGKDGV